MDDRFPSRGFFEKLERRIGEASERFAQLGLFDATFALRIQPGAGWNEERLVVLSFDGFTCRGIRHVAPAEVPPDVDFVLEAPFPVWTEMLASTTASGEIDAAHGINTLAHYDHPVRVTYRTPEGHDKLYRYQASVQLVLDLAASAHAAPTRSPGPGS